jgi:hypothetical protein
MEAGDRDGKDLHDLSSLDSVAARAISPNPGLQGR